MAKESLKKPSRIKSKRNLELIRSLPCSVCEKPAPSEAEHWATKGSGGSDDLTNLWSTCRKHHIEKGTLGIKTFWDRYHSRIILFREKYELPPLNVDNIKN